MAGVHGLATKIRFKQATCAIASIATINGNDEFLRVQVNVTPKGIAKFAEELIGDEALLIEG